MYAYFLCIALSIANHFYAMEDKEIIINNNQITKIDVGENLLIFKKDFEKENGRIIFVNHTEKMKTYPVYATFSFNFKNNDMITNPLEIYMPTGFPLIAGCYTRERLKNFSSVFQAQFTLPEKYNLLEQNFTLLKALFYGFEDENWKKHFNYMAYDFSTLLGDITTILKSSNDYSKLIELKEQIKQFMKENYIKTIGTQ